jgi:hypothetical protein
MSVHSVGQVISVKSSPAVRSGVQSCSRATVCLFKTLNGGRRFGTVFTADGYCTVSGAEQIRSKISPPTSSRSILISLPPPFAPRSLKWTLPFLSFLNVLFLHCLPSTYRPFRVHQLKNIGAQRKPCSNRLLGCPIGPHSVRGCPIGPHSVRGCPIGPHSVLGCPIGPHSVLGCPIGPHSVPVLPVRTQSSFTPRRIKLVKL